MDSIIRAKISNMPEAPGIYKMLDARGDIIYIGKSKCLKKRVKSYFVASPKWEKARKMAPFIHDIAYIETDTHLEALLLECELIKEVQPLFNVQMKNDGRYVYVKIANHHCSVVHEREENCFGPYRSKHVLQSMLDRLKSIYPIDKQLEYHVLPVTMSKAEAERNFKLVLEMFHNTNQMEVLTRQLEQKMQEASSKLQFGLAAKYRDIVEAVGYLKTGIDCYHGLLEKDLLLKIKLDNYYKLFFISKGQVLYKKRVARLSERTQKQFLVNAKQQKQSLNMTEKGLIDYRDILLSEIDQLPEEAVVIIED